MQMASKSTILIGIGLMHLVCLEIINLIQNGKLIGDLHFNLVKPILQ